VDEYLHMTLLSREGEAEADFQTRISQTWTSVLRTSEEAFEKVYAELTTYEKVGARLGRKYMVEADGIDELLSLLKGVSMDVAEVDRDDVYSKYEATPPEWFWIEH
jgi:hypothetical protein